MIVSRLLVQHRLFVRVSPCSSRPLFNYVCARMNITNGLKQKDVSISLIQPRTLRRRWWWLNDVIEEFSPVVQTSYSIKGSLQPSLPLVTQSFSSSSSSSSTKDSGIVTTTRQILVTNKIQQMAWVNPIPPAESPRRSSMTRCNFSTSSSEPRTKHHTTIERTSQHRETILTMRSLGDSLRAEQKNSTQETAKSDTDSASPVLPVKVPISSWIYIEKTAPLTSLDTMLHSIYQALQSELNTRGILDLDAPWPPVTEDEGNPNRIHDLPFLEPLHELEDLKNGIQQDVYTTNQATGFVQKALVAISSYGRPMGWFIKFKNVSLAYALLMHTSQPHKETILRNRDIQDHFAQHYLKLSWKFVRVSEYTGPIDPSTDTPTSKVKCFVPNDNITDSTIRVENCPEKTNEKMLYSLFDRYELACSRLQKRRFQQRPSVQRWNGMLPDGKKNSHPVFLVHFASPEWARAAIREKQSSRLRLDLDLPLRLVQFPKQLLGNERD